MRFWNIGDERLIRHLRAEITDASVSFEVGPDGGVAVYCGVRFLGVWVEFVRGRHSFVPAARLQPTLIHFTMEQVVMATRGLLVATPADTGQVAARK